MHENPELDLFLDLYSKKDLRVARGSGVRVYTEDGKEYLDMTGSYGVAILGYAHPQVAKAVAEQAMILQSNHFSTYTPAREVLAERLSRIRPIPESKAVLLNTGTEAVEFALKAIRRYTGRHKILAFTNSFHGRTLGALSATWNPKYRTGFDPLFPVTFVQYGNIERVKQALSDREIGGVLYEPVQGEGGVNPAPVGFGKALREVTQDASVVLVSDEIQTGLGRTGEMWASLSEFQPDVLVAAKGLANGLPASVCFLSREIGTKFSPGDHGSTYAGGPIVSAAAAATLGVLLDTDILSNLRQRSSELETVLASLARQFAEFIRGVRLKGLMIGVEFRRPVSEVIKGALSNRLVLLTAGINVVRMLPPYVLTHSDIAEFEERFRTTLEELSQDGRKDAATEPHQ